MTNKYDITKMLKRLKRSMADHEIVGFCNGYISLEKKLVKCDKFRFENKWYSSDLFPAIRNYGRLSHSYCPDCVVKFREVWKACELEKILKGDKK